MNLLKSEEFIFREWQLEDVEAIRTIFGNPMVTKNLWASGAPLTTEAFKKSLEFFLNQYQ